MIKHFWLPQIFSSYTPILKVYVLTFMYGLKYEWISESAPIASKTQGHSLIDYYKQQDDFRPFNCRSYRKK